MAVFMKKKKIYDKTAQMKIDINQMDEMIYETKLPQPMKKKIP